MILVPITKNVYHKIEQFNDYLLIYFFICNVGLNKIIINLLLIIFPKVYTKTYLLLDSMPSITKLFALFFAQKKIRKTLNKKTLIFYLLLQKM